MKKYLLAIPISLVISSCNKAEINPDELVGSWQSLETSSNYVFEEDMTFHFIGDSTAGTYTFSDDDLSMSYLQPNGSLYFTDYWKVLELTSTTLILGVEDSKGKIVSDEEFQKL